MTEADVLLEWDGPLAIVTMNRPAVLNSFTPGLLAELKSAVDEARTKEARAIFVTGAGRGFCAGQDLASIQDQYATGGPDLAALLRDHFHPLFRAIRESPIPIIAGVNGVAAGAGFSLALACDLRVASASARFATAFTRIGLVPDAGMAYTLPRLIGAAKANSMMLLGDQVDASTAFGLGLVDRVFDADSFQDDARSFALGVANGPTRAFALTKSLAQQAERLTFRELLESEAETQGIAGKTADHQGAVAAFLRKETMTFEGR